MHRPERVDVPILDEAEFVPCYRQAGELLFEVFASRQGRRSIGVTSNLSCVATHHRFNAERFEMRKGRRRRYPFSGGHHSDT
jgi:hypothetical protein